MTDVTVKASWFGALLLALGSFAFAQTATPKRPDPEALYLQLQSVGLDPARVFKIRDGALERGAVHISLNDGIIAFTKEVGGHMTGAFFRGDGEILISPPNTVERASMALFTGAAILDERFAVAYFRFNDDLFAELQSSLRPPDEPGAFLEQWNTSAQNLAPQDALRLLVSFSRAERAPNDRLLHAYIQGDRRGTFEVRYDSSLPEQVSVGQHKTVENISYYDVWTSFAQTRTQPGETDPDTGLFGSHDFDITQFKIQTNIALPHEISSTATLSIAPRRNGSTILLFELSRLLDVKSVEADGTPVQFIHNQAVEGSQLAKRGNDALAVFLPIPTKNGIPLTLKIVYSGPVLSEAANGLLYVGEHGTWYPNVGFAIASFDLQFRYPAGWTLIATGRRAELKQEGGQQVSRWITEKKVPVAGFNLGKYERAGTRAAGVDVETYATANVEKGLVTQKNDPLPIQNPNFRRNPQVLLLPPPPPPAPSPSRNLQQVNASAAQAVEFYSHEFGEYPYTSLALTQFPGRISQGWPGLVFLSSYAFLSPDEQKQLGDTPGQRVVLEQVVPHEIAHQWWGDLVSWSGYRDQWIMEALANYSAAMLLETKNPAKFRLLLTKYRDDLLAKGHDDHLLMDAGPVTLGLRLSSSEFPAGYEAISYGRGTWMFHMLRTMLRDSGGSTGRGKPDEEPFMRALRRLRTEYESRPVSTAQLLAVFEAELPKSLWYEGKKSLEWFNDSWLNGTAVPDFELRDIKFTRKQEATTVSGSIVQNDAPDSLVTAVPLYAVVDGKNIFLKRVFAEGHETPFHLSAPAGTRKMLLDPEGTLLSRAKRQ